MRKLRISSTQAAPRKISFPRIGPLFVPASGDSAPDSQMLPCTTYSGRRNDVAATPAAVPTPTMTRHNHL